MLVDGLRLPAAAFRAVLLVLCVCLAVIPDGVNADALARLAVLAIAAAVLTQVGHRTAVAVPVVLLETVMTAAFVSGSGGSQSPVLPYLLAPALSLGLAGGIRAVLLGALSAVLSATAVRLSSDVADTTAQFVTALVQWVLLGGALGLLGAWARRLSTAPPVEVPRFVQVRELLEELRAVTRSLPGGLDAPSVADGLLERCAAHAPVSRSAVLVQVSTGSVVPLAVRGTRRVPWRAPLSEPGPLQEAWDTGQPVVDARQPDIGGRRRGSALAVFPLMSSDSAFGLVILESFELDAFDDLDVVARLTSVVEEGAVRLEPALLFEEVRSTATLEERDRLAREMHDGMAQDIAFLGYQLDDLRGRAAKVDPELALRVAEVRTDLTRLISDIRFSITDLRTSVSADRGLGQALSTYVRALGSGKDVTVHLSLQESPFRLPGDHEVLLFQVAQAVAQDVRKGQQAANFWVTLVVDPPSATLQVEHDGRWNDLDGLGLKEHAEALARLGGVLRVEEREDGGPRVLAELRGGDDGDPGPAGR